MAPLIDLELFLFGLLVASLAVPVVGYVGYRQLAEYYRRLPAAVQIPGVEALLRQKEERVGQLDEQIAAGNEALAKRNIAEREVRIYEERLAVIRSELDSLEGRRNELDEVERNIAEALETLTQHEQRLGERTGELRAIEDRIARDTERAKEVDAHCSVLKAQVNELADREREQRSAAETISQALRAAQDTLEGTERELRDAKTALIENRAEAERLAEHVADLKAATAQYEATKVGLEKSLEALEKADIQLTATPATGEKASDPLQELRNPPGCLRKASPLPEHEERDALKRVRDHLAANGLSFPHRTIDAFHTSLKIADISALTVLAGISGTGKSELPRRYAEAVGLDFLMVPVQPRWDSPQDLFGFYNFLERRYKATELVRALIRFDPERWDDIAESYSDRVLLVLLDEMNLARVEYYFSEFLSVLEVRKSAPDRAEVPIDLGTEVRRLRLFPNALYVGTMNEDESTQTLSDKVLDRANTLRFARPARFPETGPSGAVEADRGYLPLSQWQRWYRTANSLPSHHRQWLDERISKMNGLLDELGRPFGHRVQQAIQLYCANHPASSSAMRNPWLPFVDQLEQRIFPKLRGIICDEHVASLDGIHDMLRDVAEDNEPVLRAYEKAREQDLFQWPGVAWEENE